ncbi:MFS transporter [Nonomuraea sp. NPDC050536]|uniref:MFS transporter n=1 Tax=Nonomuraea sp. NPDC050536 TaxID=3364366 RepID=UPI0037CAA917
MSRTAQDSTRSWRTHIAALVGSVAVTSTSDGILFVSAPLIATSMSDDPRVIAGVTVAATLPYLVLALPSGLLVDRLPLRPMLLTVALTRAILAGILALAVVTGQLSLPLLYVCVFSLEACRATFDTTVKVVTPQIVPKDQIESGNRRILFGQFLGDGITGRSLGGLLYAFGSQLSLLVYAVCQLAVAFLSRTAVRGIPVHRRGISSRDLTAGLAWVAGNGPIRGLAVLHGCRSLTSGATSGVLAVFLLQELDVPSRWYGIMLVSLPIGGFIALYVSRKAVRLATTPQVILSVLATDIALYFLLGVTGTSVVVPVLLAAIAFNGVLWNLSTLGFRQRIVPGDVQGRVQSVYAALQFGLIPAGAAAGGYLATLDGARPVIVSAGIFLVAPLVYALLLRPSVQAAALSAEREESRE